MTLFGTTRHSGYDFTMPRHDMWREQAACIGSDPEIFNLVQVSGNAKAPEIREVLERNRFNFSKALAFCAICPVGQECEDDADQDDKAFTVRGGVLPTLFTNKGRGRPPKGRERTCLNGHKGSWKNTATGRLCLVCGAGPTKGRPIDPSRVLSPENVSQRVRERHVRMHRDHTPSWALDSNGYAECRICKKQSNKRRRMSAPSEKVQASHLANHPDHPAAWRSNGQGGFRCGTCVNERKRLARQAAKV